MYWSLKGEWALLDFVDKFKYGYNYLDVYVPSKYEHVHEVLFKYKAAKVFYLEIN